MNVSVCFYIFGILLLFFSSVVFASGFVGLAYADSSYHIFFIIGIILAFFAAILAFSQKPDNLKLTSKQGFLITVMTWLGLSFAGSLPLYFSIENISFMDAWFESVSAITTTGATVLSGLEHLDKSVQFWRMILQWLGGMGILVLAVAVLPFLGIGGMKLYKNELPGVSKDKLQPRIAETAKVLWGIYLFLTVLFALLYYLFGMNLFDAITHSFTTIATSGFSNYDASFGFFNNPTLEYIAIFGMAICGINFTLHYLLISKGNFKNYFKSEELKFFIAVLVIAVAMVYFIRVVTGEVAGEYMMHFRHTLFNITSLLTTTGYAVSDYDQWHEVSPMIVLILMFVGGCSGSTTGGMKALRMLVASKQGIRELKKLLTPNIISYIKLDNKTIDLEIIKSIFGFIGLFVLTFCVLSIILSACGLDFKTAISAAAATLTNAGPGLGEVGPASNYGSLPDFSKLILSISMLLGRLEIFTFVVILLPSFWRK
ncbi:MAG: Trk system potassium uptake protein TrkH [Proteobacteria bacterium]|nr:MAG: Trk system potassium uptake protein TrkH [Pseudomonadota bacterium]